MIYTISNQSMSRLNKNILTFMWNSTCLKHQSFCCKKNLFNCKKVIFQYQEGEYKVIEYSQQDSVWCYYLIRVKMFRFISFVYFSTILAAVSSGFLSDIVKTFQFTVIENAKNQLNFELVKRSFWILIPSFSKFSLVFWI